MKRKDKKVWEEQKVKVVIVARGKISLRLPSERGSECGHTETAHGKIPNRRGGVTWRCGVFFIGGASDNGRMDDKDDSHR